MKYEEFVKNNFGEEYILEVGDRAITTREVSCVARYFKEGTVVTIIDVSFKGYDLMDEHGNVIIETGWSNVRRLQEA
jgi:hypothetical protein